MSGRIEKGYKIPSLPKKKLLTMRTKRPARQSRAPRRHTNNANSILTKLRAIWSFFFLTSVWVVCLGSHPCFRVSLFFRILRCPSRSSARGPSFHALRHLAEVVSGCSSTGLGPTAEKKIQERRGNGGEEEHKPSTTNGRGVAAPDGKLGTAVRLGPF